MSLGFILALCLALLHIFAGKLRLLEAIPRCRWTSLAGGISIAYIFLDVFPELAHAQEAIAHSEVPLLSYLEQHVYLLSLLGLVIFYGLDQIVLRSRRHRQRMGHPDSTSASIFWIRISAFAIYNMILGYLLRESENHGLVACLLLFVVLGLHFLVNDLGFREHHKKIYDRWGRWLLAAAILVGWIVGQVQTLNEAALSIVWAIVAGGVILNVLKEELPEHQDSEFPSFVAGAAGYSLLLLMV
jgi:uncharacterized membrane protein YkvI